MELTFGTAGIRGVVGKTKDKLNEAHASQIFHAFAKYINHRYPNEKNKTIVIGRDNRIKGKDFTILAANILTSYGIKIYFNNEMLATPFISFLIINKKALGGINVTASHNPKEYNGIKLYNASGYQMLPNEIEEIKKYFQDYENYVDQIQGDIKLNQSNLILNIEQKDYQNYIDQIIMLDKKNHDLSNLKIVYSPLHGTGFNFVKSIFEKLNANVTYEPNEIYEDENFSYVKNPNPESMVAFANSLVLAKKENADIIIVTDPDSDRIGVAYKDAQNNYQLINGNENAILITDYLLENTLIDSNKENYLIYSLVSTSLPSKMCQSKNITSYKTQTGFKWIGQLIKEKQDAKLFFAFEESYGSLIDNNISLDKDAIQGTLIISLIASIAKKNNMNLGDKLNSIYQEHGFLKTKSFAYDLESENQLNKIKNLFKSIQFTNSEFYDFNSSQEENLKNDMYAYYFNDSLNWIALRPSGTEPKFKIYIHVVEKSKEEANNKFNQLLSEIKKQLNLK